MVDGHERDHSVETYQYNEHKKYHPEHHEGRDVSVIKVRVVSVLS